MSKYLKTIGLKSRCAFQQSLSVDGSKKNLVLKKFNTLLKTECNVILKKNYSDLKIANKKKLKDNMIDRLTLNKKRIDSIRHSINEIIKFKDPVGRIIASWKRPNGLLIKKISIPIGVIGVIFESRPNVACDVSALCFKSGNTAILRGGSESLNSNSIFIDLFRESLKKSGFSKNCVQLIKNQDRKLVDFFLSRMTNYVDVIIPRGGKSLVKKVQTKSKVPTIGHLEGVCHIYVDKEADLKVSTEVINNSKLRKTSSCGALETLLIDKNIINTFCKPILDNLIKNGCKIIGDKNIINNYDGKVALAKESDWKKEYLASTISVKCVDGVDEAINHINKYGTMHTDSIITKNKKTAKKFLDKINSSIALHNASTQFADGGEFGFGAEVGISTGKLHPRGPVGLEQLTSYKYKLYGNGQIRK
tara:strand:+ start:846 stop:2102 length:1257 start_codon:yes stop_codon:yes gene_type:complete